MGLGLLSSPWQPISSPSFETTVDSSERLPTDSIRKRLKVFYGFKLCDLPKLWCGNTVPLKIMARQLPYQPDLLRRPWECRRNFRRFRFGTRPLPHSQKQIQSKLMQHNRALKEMIRLNTEPQQALCRAKRQGLGLLSSPWQPISSPSFETTVDSSESLSTASVRKRLRSPGRNPVGTSGDSSKGSWMGRLHPRQLQSSQHTQHTHSSLRCTHLPPIRLRCHPGCCPPPPTSPRARLCNGHDPGHTRGAGSSDQEVKIFLSPFAFRPDFLLHPEEMPIPGYQGVG